MGGSFQRIQFTPDLLPSDVVGTMIFSPKDGGFATHKGPIFANLVLADEINRAPAKVQSALLEAMQERQVTIGGHSHILPKPFFVMATQNPVEQEGTYPLPEAQKDRFMMKIRMPLPGRETELELAHRMLSGDAPEKAPGGAVRGARVPLRRMAAGVARLARASPYARANWLGYVLDVVRRTRQEESVLVGAGPRATQSLLGAAARQRRPRRCATSSLPMTSRLMAPAVLEHRLILRPEFEVEGLDRGRSGEARCLSSVPVPA
jgi:MoxR-like ATPase